MRVWLPLVEAGSGSDVFTYRLGGALAEFGIEAVIETFPGRLQYCPWILKAAVMPENIEAVIANSWNAVGFSRIGVPLISVQHLCVHDPLYAPYRSRAQALFHDHLVRQAERGGYLKADITVSVSAATRHATINAFPDIFAGTNPRKPIHTILNGIDTGFFTPDHAIEPDLKSLLFVGNPTPRKGLDLLIPILEALGPEWRLHVIQGREKAVRLQGHPQVFLQGRMDRSGVRDAMRRAGMLLFPTRLEGLPLVAIEAMASGLPVAAGRQSSLPEVITDGEDGLLCWPDDVEDFASRIRETLSNPARAMAMRKAARQKAARAFSEQRMAQDYALLLREVVNARAESRPIDPKNFTPLLHRAA